MSCFTEECYSSRPSSKGALCTAVPNSSRITANPSVDKCSSHTTESFQPDGHLILVAKPHAAPCRSYHTALSCAQAGTPEAGTHGMKRAAASPAQHCFHLLSPWNSFSPYFSTYLGSQGFLPGAATCLGEKCRTLVLHCCLGKPPRTFSGRQ